MVIMRKMGIQVVVIFGFVFFAQHSVATHAGACEGAISFSELFEKSYLISLLFIQKGIPSHIVTNLFGFAFQDILSRTSCVCDSSGDIEVTGIKVECVERVFLSRDIFIVLALDKLIGEDLERENKERYFPFFHKNEKLTVPDLSDAQASIASNTMEVSWKRFLDVFKETVDAYRMRTENYVHWIFAKFPADEEILHDPEAARVCKKFKKKANPSSKFVSGTFVVAYGIAVIIHAQLAGLDSATAERFFAKAVKFTFKAARCQRRDGNHVRIPETYMKTYVKRARRLASGASSGNEEDRKSFLTSISDSKSLNIPYSLFENGIKQLSSISGYGRLLTFTVNQNKLSMEPILPRIRSIDKREYMLLQHGGQGLMGGLSCPHGFKIVTRLIAVSYYNENCCLSSCLKTSGDFLTAAINQEICCASCNAYICEQDRDYTNSSGFKRMGSVEAEGGEQIIML